MTRSEYMIKKYDDFRVQYIGKKMEFYRHPSSERIDPFRIADRLYYVGDKKVCMHLIDTDDGLILIDSGYLGTEHILVDNIWRAGFDPRNVKIILHTHGHSDHFGASEEFKRMYGSKLVISKIDADLVRRTDPSSTLYPLATAPTFDEEIEDGDIIELGSVKIRCVLSPGHTEGVLSLFFDVTYEGKSYTAGLFGGAGTNALSLPYMYKNGYENLPEKMLKSIEMLRGEKVDIHLGNHPGNNDTIGKREKQLIEGGNPFIDEGSWGRFLDKLERKVHEVISENERLNAEYDAAYGKE